MSIKSIPMTSVLTYISGMHSLNLDLEDGTGYDWHFMNYWLDGKIPIKLYGNQHEINTNHIYGYYGVADRSKLLEKLGVRRNHIFVADHHRAVIDLVYESLTKYNMIGYAKGCVEDYFFEEFHKLELFKQLTIMINHLEEDKGEILNEWLSREFRSLYKSWSSGALQIRTITSYGSNFIQN